MQPREICPISVLVHKWILSYMRGLVRNHKTLTLFGQVRQSTQRNAIKRLCIKLTGDLATYAIF
jgi:hypothetical protein